jgi:hypothetical protein
MKTNDQILLEEAYLRINEAKKKDLTGDGKVDSNDYLKARDLAIKKAKTKKEGKPSKKNDKEELEEAYQQILESKYINKKFARRYNKVTAALLKAEPGSEDYQKLKSERDDLMSILKDHGKSVSDLEELLAKKEKENPLPDTDFAPNTDNQYGDSSYSDTSDLGSNVVQGDFSNNTPEATPEVPQTAVAQ